LKMSEGMLQVWEDGLSDSLRLNRPESDNMIWPNMLQIGVW